MLNLSDPEHHDLPNGHVSDEEASDHGIQKLDRHRQDKILKASSDKNIILILRAVTSLLVWLLIHAHVASHSLAPHRQLQSYD
ncbi:hypothetical protein SDJN02_10818, partial [Cucurbita argyrosperma subsp. argyrosperma]